LDPVLCDHPVPECAVRQYTAAFESSISEIRFTVLARTIINIRDWTGPVGRSWVNVTIATNNLHLAALLPIGLDGLWSPSGRYGEDEILDRGLNSAVFNDITVSVYQTEAPEE
jgi:hypothetical protein